MAWQSSSLEDLPPPPTASLGAKGPVKDLSQSSSPFANWDDVPPPPNVSLDTYFIERAKKPERADFNTSSNFSWDSFHIGHQMSSSTQENPYHQLLYPEIFEGKKDSSVDDTPMEIDFWNEPLPITQSNSFFPSPDQNVWGAPSALLSRWVTVFGFRKHQSSAVSTEMKKFGPIVSQAPCPKGGNLMHVEYEHAESASLALSKKNIHISPTFVVGVKPMERENWQRIAFQPKSSEAISSSGAVGELELRQQYLISSEGKKDFDSARPNDTKSPFFQSLISLFGF